MKLYKLTKRLTYVRRLADNIWGLMCLASVPSLCALAGFWYFEPAHGATVRTHYIPTLYARPGEYTHVGSGVEITIPSDRMVYNFVLLDSFGRSVYEWPAIASNNNSSMLFEAVNITMPAQVHHGEYQLAATITYMMNPIKNGTLQVKLAKLNVSDDVSYFEWENP